MSQLIEAKNSQEWLSHIHRELDSTPADSLYLPAGSTPKPLYADWCKDPPAYLKGKTLLQIDEVLNGDNPFAKFFKNELGSVAPVKPVNLGNHQAEVALLGLGLNGHVGFHEPGVPRNFYSGCVRLKPETCQGLGVSPDTWGCTYGLGAFLNCRKILLLVRGETKQQILKSILNEASDLPAAQVARHPHTVILNQTSV